VLWLPSNFIPEVDICLLLAMAAMTGFFNLHLPGLSEASNAGEKAHVFKPLSKLVRQGKKRQDGEECAGDSRESAASQRIGSILQDISSGSTSARYSSFAVPCISPLVTGASLRRGALATMRSARVPRDICADVTGHAVVVPGGTNGGTVHTSSALHNCDNIAPADVAEGTMALGGWQPIGGVAPTVATLEPLLLGCGVTTDVLNRLARLLFRLDSSITPMLLPGKRLEVLTHTMLAHAIV
jgi:hypothetical protein